MSAYDEPQKILEWVATLSCERKKHPDCVCRPCMARRIVSGKNDPCQVQETFREQITSLRAEVASLKEDVSVARQSLYEVVGQRNGLDSEVKRLKATLVRIARDAQYDMNKAHTQHDRDRFAHLWRVAEGRG